MANNDNLIPINKRTKSEQREIQQKGGLASGAVRRKNAALADVIDLVTKMPMHKGKLTAVKAFDDTKDEDANLTVAEQMVIAQVTRALKGDPASFKIISEIMEGRKPKEKTDDIRQDGLSAALESVVTELESDDK